MKKVFLATQNKAVSNLDNNLIGQRHERLSHNRERIKCFCKERMHFMNKLVKCLLLLAVTFFLAMSSPSWAGRPGKFATALKNSFCQGTSGSTWYGCYAYMYYRVDSIKNNATAKSYCYTYGCSRQYSAGSASLKNCKSGCDKAYNADTK
jgi:hypothetical protein